MDSSEFTQEQVEEIAMFLDTATGHVGETTRTMLSLLKKWGFNTANPSYANEILLTRLGVQRAEIFKSLNAPCSEDLLKQPASKNISDFITFPIRMNRELHSKAFQYDSVDFKQELPLYIFMLMLIERAEKRKQLFLNPIAAQISIALIYRIIESEFPEFSHFSKLNSINSLMYGGVIFKNIVEKLGLTERYV